ncbi:MAG: ADP-ribosylglycohydrolase family protein [Pseudonocardia sp.]|nr:ADP-ribosylglycohydrolase family protein [Pseudonocardia sp.]
MDLEVAERSRISAVEPDELQDRVRGALLGGACGDSLGAPFEGRSTVDRADFVLHRFAASPLVHTDDTAMTLVVAQHLVSRDAAGQDRDLDGDALALALAAEWRAEPWRGYGTGPEQIFRALLRDEDWRRVASDLFDGTGSYGNGGATRIAPVALTTLPLTEVCEQARAVARITHQHAIGQAGAALLAAAVALAFTLPRDTELDRSWFLDVLDECHRQPQFRARQTPLRHVLDDSRPSPATRSLGNGIAALESVPMAVLAFLRSPDDPEQTLEFAARVGGDTDSIAAMAGTLAGARCGASGLPPDLLIRLDVRPRIAAVADALCRSVPRTRIVPSA